MLSEIDEDGSRQVDAMELANKGAGVIISLVNVQEQQARAERMSDVRGQMDGVVAGCGSAEQLRGKLTEAFSALDGDRSGSLDEAQARQAIATSIGEQIGAKEMQALLSLLVEATDEDGRVAYELIAEYAYDCLAWLKEQELHAAYGDE